MPGGGSDERDNDGLPGSGEAPFGPSADPPPDASPDPLQDPLAPAFDLPAGLDLESANPAAIELPASDPAAPPAFDSFSDPPAEGSQDAAAVPAQAPEAQEAPSEAPSAAPEAPADAIQKVKEFAEQVPMEKIRVPAAFPFSLLIEGELSAVEREKLVDVLSRENMGIREVDLEPQFAGHRVLIPRISEYAGVLLVQALRGTSARMRLGPSDSIFSTEDTSRGADPVQLGGQPPEPEAHRLPSEPFIHPAEAIPVTSGDGFPQFEGYPVLDTLVASTILTSPAVEAERTSEYQEVVENLLRELRYKAHRKGAVGVARFQIQLQALTLAMQYRLTVTGSLVFAPSPEAGETAAPLADADPPPEETSH